MMCDKCFASKYGGCMALTERLDPCPFFKTPEQAEKDATEAKKRLLELVGGFDLWQRINDNNAYKCRQYKAKKKQDNERE